MGLETWTRIAIIAIPVVLLLHVIVLWHVFGGLALLEEAMKRLSDGGARAKGNSWDDR